MPLHDDTQPDRNGHGRPILVDPVELAELIRDAVAEALRKPGGDGELIGVQTVADLIGDTSPRTVWRLSSASASTGFPQPLKLGRASRWRRSEVEAWLAGLNSGDVIELPADSGEG